MTYKVIWVDDEWEKFSEIQETLENNGIKLTPFHTRKEGMENLEANLEDYDAVLLDAKMKDASEEEVSSVKGLSKCIDKINQLKIKKAFPYFIFTGQPGLMKNKDFIDLYGEKIYYKYDLESIDKLISDMSFELNSLPEIQIKSRYNDVFQAIRNLKLPKESERVFLDILISLHFIEDRPDFSPKLYYNQLRQLVESIFRACYQVGIVPPECVPDDKINLNQCSLYLAGKNTEHAGVRYREEGNKIIPSHIEQIIKVILDLGNLYSHTSGNNVNDDAYKSIIKAANSKYIIYSLCFGLFEVILFFDEYIKKHPDKNKNLENRKYLNDSGHPLEGHICFPQKDDNGIWHVEDCMVGIKYWDSNKKMKLKNICKNTDSKTSRKYPYFAKFDMLDKENS